MRSVNEVIHFGITWLDVAPDLLLVLPQWHPSHFGGNLSDTWCWWCRCSFSDHKLFLAKFSVNALCFETGHSTHYMELEMNLTGYILGKCEQKFLALLTHGYWNTFCVFPALLQDLNLCVLPAQAKHLPKFVVSSSEHGRTKCWFDTRWTEITKSECCCSVSQKCWLAECQWKVKLMQR